MEANIVLVDLDIIIFFPMSNQWCAFTGHLDGVHHGVSVKPKVRDETRSSSLQAMLPALLNGFPWNKNMYLYELQKLSVAENLTWARAHNGEWQNIGHTLQ